MATSPSITESPIAEHWPRFLERLAAANDRLISEMETCWREMQAILEHQLGYLESTPVPRLAQPGLDDFQQTRAEVSRRLLIESLAQWDRRRPYQRTLMALETYDRSLEDLIKSLPESVSVNGHQALAVLGQWATSGWRQRLAALRHKKWELPLEAIVAGECRRLSWQRLKIEGQFLLILAQSIRQLKKNWETRCAALDALAQGKPFSNRAAEAQRKVINHSRELARQAEIVSLEWRGWPELSVQRLASRVLSSVVWHRRRKHDAPGKRRERAFTHWVDQLRALEAEVRLESSLERSEDRLLSRSRRALDSLDQERSHLLTELDGFIAWLRRRIEQHSQEDVPSPKTEVVPASSRLAELEAGLKAELKALPQSVQTLPRFSALSRRRSKLKEVFPRKTLEEAFARTGRSSIAQTFAEIEIEHSKIVQEIVRAREVVAFGLELDGATPESDPQITEEALQNALSLLEFYRREAPDWRPEADAQMAQTLAAVFDEGRLILRRDRLGIFAHLAQQGTRQAIAHASRSALAATSKLARRFYRTLEHLVIRFLVYIGWRPEPTAGKVEVITRPFLPQEFTVEIAAKELPAIYRRLFRYEAVEDPRFLVGREREMAAIAEARSFWEAHRPASLLIVGQRGSGKTSLINCALKQSLEGLEVIRGEFNERLITEAQLRGFEAELLGIENAANLEKVLAQQRRVIILEEMERTFLRQVGHYAALRALQRLIAATCSSTLWILVINQVAFKFLDAALNLGDSFSHRINAATASRDSLREAILLRHNLSGLRLQFGLPPEQRKLTARLKSKLQGQADPEKIFFDALAKESAGVFRTAFDIWLGQIETVEAGVLYMKPLVSPDLSPVIDELDLEDLFTLVAILQHGSLTPEEHAAVFQYSIASSRAQMDELRAREIIEPDPGRPGLRVRPEAMRIVREALYRRNLL